MSGAPHSGDPAQWWTDITVGQTLHHRVFGEGTVIVVQQHRVSVDFGQAFGIKALKRAPSQYDDVHLIGPPGGETTSAPTRDT